MGPKDRKTVEREDKDGWKHSTTYDPKTNNRWSVDYKDTGLGGVGSNWFEVKNAHHTDQDDNTHDDNVRFGEST
ncbi:MAG: hypothetical protein RBS01_02575 [Candidatus Dojkabacteria bacterium]|jgi:hypothetical protein|nr:hypothetical protein [Candidatus Dojkabacteria bacterium]